VNFWLIYFNEGPIETVTTESHRYVRLHYLSVRKDEAERRRLAFFKAVK
jgi:hypothetical protein